jgi:hypothetical protein
MLQIKIILPSHTSDSDILTVGKLSDLNQVATLYRSSKMLTPVNCENSHVCILIQTATIMK